MGTGWRRAFCTTIPRDPADQNRVSEKQQISPNPSPRSCTRLGIFSGGSNPSTPRLKSQPLISTQSSNVDQESPRLLECKITTPKGSRASFLSSSNPTSPRSPLKLSLFRNSFKFRSSCGICLNSVKTGQGTAIYTAECGHAFHFPCIAAHVRSHGSLVCPVCNCTWKDVPLLAIHKNVNNTSQNDNVGTTPNLKQKPKQRPTEVQKKVIMESTSSPRASSKPLYDDDEPLLSPTSRIIPIPEVDDEEDDATDPELESDDVEEFQGFFVNPNPSSSDSLISGRDFKTNNVQVRIVPDSALLSSGRGSDTYVVALRVKAPPPPILNPSNRVSIDLVAVLDVSGSMTGAKLQMLKRAMRLVISSLGFNDRLSIVAFSASTKRLLPLKRMTAHGQRLAMRVVDRLVCGQGTSVGDALRKATKVLEDRRERNPVASVMLLSDGQDERVKNSANQRQGSSHVSSTRFAHIEIPVHAFGFGETGGFSQEPAEDAFAKCVAGLLSVVVQDLRIQLAFESGSAPAEISAIYSCNGGPTVHGSASVRLGDLYAEEERELLVELRVPRALARGANHVMSVRCLYKDPATQEIVYGREQALLVPLTTSAGRSSPGPKIERLRGLFITTRAVAESRRLVEHNDYSSAHQLLASARALLMKSGSASADDYVRSLEAELAELHWKRQHKIMEEQQQMMMTTQRRRGGSEREMAAVVDENGEPLTPTSAWRAAEKLAKVAMMKKSLNRISDLHGFENARF